MVSLSMKNRGLTMKKNDLTMNNGDFIVILISTGYVNLCFTLSLGGWSDVMIARERERVTTVFYAFKVVSPG